MMLLVGAPNGLVGDVGGRHTSAISELPASVRAHLSLRALDIYREAFNHAWRDYLVDERLAHRIAWSTVKRSYLKDAGGRWVRSKIQGDWSRPSNKGTLRKWFRTARLPPVYSGQATMKRSRPTLMVMAHIFRRHA
jgi:cation transport regulator